MNKHYFFLILIFSIFSLQGYSNPLSEVCNSIAKSNTLVVIPTFNSFGPYCVNSIAPALPTTSLNGITGVWSPSIINTNFVGTTNYTFTPNIGQDATSVNINITISPQPNAGALAGNQNICIGMTANFISTLSGGVWTSANTAVATVNAVTGLVTGVAAGTTTMVYTIAGAAPCSNATATRTVTVNAQPSTGILSGDQVLCHEDTTVFTSTVTGGTWTSSDTSIAVIDAMNGVVTPIAYNGTATMAYTVIGIGGCQNATTTRTVTVAAPDLELTSGSSNQTVAINTSIQDIVFSSFYVTTLTVNDLPMGITWNHTNGLLTISGTPTVSGIFEYTIDWGGDCPVFVRQTGVISVTPFATITGNTRICLPGLNTTQLTCSGIPASINPWTSSNNAVATVSNTGLVTAVSFGTTTINYHDDLGNTAAVNVIVASSPTISSPSGSTVTCAGGLLELTGSPTANPTPWSSSNTAIATVDNYGLVTGVSGGTCNIIYTDSSGCNASGTVVIKPLLSPVISCGVSTANQITINWAPVLGALNYIIVYNINGGSFTFGASGNILSYTLNGLSPGDYVDFYVTPSGAVETCFTSGTVRCNTTVNCDGTNTPAQPVVMLTQPTCTVPTGSITIVAVAGNTYSLDGGPYTTTLLYSGLAAGSTHTVTAKNALGCISTATVITINAQPSTPTAPLVIVIQPTCTTATGSIIITVVSGETYSLDGGPYTSTTNYNGLAAGSTHSVVAKNAIGCVSSLTTVSINNQPTTSNVILFCDVPQFPNSVAFDWNPVQGFTSYNYTYSIDNQPSVSGTTVMSNFQVLGVLQGQSVTFSLLINEGICSGVFTATCSTLANTDFENGDIQYFPNPVNDILNITSLKTTATIQIINAIGQQVYSERITTKDTQIEMSTLTKGIYIAKVTSENQIQTFKVIKK